VLANLFMHYAFDRWMAERSPTIQFERHADDAVVHCVSKRQANMLVKAIADRMAEVGLRLHPAKTRIVYCKDANRRVGMRTPRSPSLGSPSAPARLATETGRRSPRFRPRSARMP
jgi:RNA-directed DNA polymerase